MVKLTKKHSIKIPNGIKVIYISNKDCILIIGPFGKKILSLKLKLIVEKSKSLLYVSKKSNFKFSGKKNKMLISLQGTLTALIRQNILEVSVILYKKLILVGVGYKVFPLENSIFHFKLGFSHSIFIRIAPDLKVTSLKSTNLYIFGNSFVKLHQMASTIRLYKYPEPYKGKGILYQNEKIKLKEGKKT